MPQIVPYGRFRTFPVATQIHFAEIPQEPSDQLVLAEYLPLLVSLATDPVPGVRLALAALIRNAPEWAAQNKNFNTFKNHLQAHEKKPIVILIENDSHY